MRFTSTPSAARTMETLPSYMQAKKAPEWASWTLPPV